MPGLFDDEDAGSEPAADDTTDAGDGKGSGAADGGEAGKGAAVEAGERPTWLPEAAWKDGAVDLTALETVIAGAGKAADLPTDAASYTMPTIEGFDPVKAAESPVIKAMQAAAFAGGVGQAGFEVAIKDYVAAETTRFETERAGEQAKLGSNAKGRLAAVGTFVRGAVPKAQAEAILSLATTADAVIGLEALMNSRAGVKPRVDPPAADTRKTKDQIETLMASPAYSGKPQQRDAAVIKEVDEWFAAEAAAQAGKK